MDRKKLKRIPIIAVVALILVGMGSCAVQYFMYSSMMYSGLDDITDGNAFCAPHKYRKVCFMWKYTLDVDEFADKIVFTVPDYCGEYRITAIGGYYGIGVPSEFILEIDGNKPLSYASYIKTHGSKLGMIEINIGPYLRDINRLWGITNDFDYRGSFCYHDGSQYRQYLVYINCAEDNPYFYSLDGRLYNKSDDTLVTKFAYWADKDKYKVNGQ